MEFDDDIDEREFVAENIDIEGVRKIVFDLLSAVGEDPGREGLQNTPDLLEK